MSTPSAAYRATLTSGEEAEKIRVSLALRKAQGNVMLAWRESLSDYSERTLKRWIAKWGLGELARDEREKARRQRKRAKAEILSAPTSNADKAQRA